MSHVCANAVPAESTLRAECHGRDVRIVFPEYREPQHLVRWLQVLLSPLVFGFFVLLIPVNHVLRCLGLSTPPLPRVRRHFEVEISAERLTFRHWFGEEVWEAADIRDVFIDEAGVEGSVYSAVFCAVSGRPVQASEPAKGYHYLYAQNGRRQISYDALSSSELVWLRDTLKIALGLS